MQTAIDLPNVICSLEAYAYAGADAGLDGLNAAMLAPQLPQNFTPSEFPLPHIGQNITISLRLDKRCEPIVGHFHNLDGIQ